MTEPEGVALQQLAAGKGVLEVGALLGFSTVLLAQVAEAVVSIDPHAGYPFDNPRETWGQFNENLLLYGVADKVTVLREDDSALLSLDTYLDGSEFGNLPIQLAFIDCDGTYPTTIRVLERVAPWLPVEGGIIAVHDYDLPEWPGAGEAVRDFCTQTGARFGVIDTLAIIRPAHPDN
jgi:predicted O-methyltransferase YrrM